MKVWATRFSLVNFASFLATTQSVMFLGLWSQALAAPPQPAALQWARQFGTGTDDLGSSIAISSNGGIFVGGTTSGNLAGSSGFDDAYLRRYDAAGNVVWTRQVGSSATDSGNGIAADNAGNIYLTGYTWGALTGSNLGATDAYLIKYDSSGTRLWTKQVGTSNWDYGNAVATDPSGNVFVTGSMEGSLGNGNVFVSKYNSAGTLLWNRIFGTLQDDQGESLTFDQSGNVYVGGTVQNSTFGSETDAFVRKYDSAGNMLWHHELDSGASEHIRGLSSDSLGNIFFAGYAGANLAGGSGGIIGKYDVDGNLIWLRQPGTFHEDYFGLAADGLGNVYLAGATDHAFPGPHQGSDDFYFAKYDSAGILLWNQQFGTTAFDQARSIVTDGQGNIYLSGSSKGSFASSNAGGYDAIVVRFAEVPEPTASYFLLLALGMLVRRRRDR